MKSITIRFVGHDRLMMEMCKNYFSNFQFIETKPILIPELFFKSTIPKKEDVIFVDLPANSQKIYEFGIKLMKLFPGSLTIALSHREDIAKVLKLQHVDKFFHKIISRNDNLTALELIVDQLRERYGIEGGKTNWAALWVLKSDLAQNCIWDEKESYPAVLFLAKVYPVI